MKLAALLALLLLPLGLAWADDDEKKDEKKKTADPIVGTWKATSYEQQGQKAEDVPDYVMTFKDGKYSQKNNGTEYETGKYKLGRDKKQQQIDIDILNGNDEGKKQPGIFKIDGDKLIWCFALPGKEGRPEKFETGKDAPYILVEFKRVKDDK